MDKLKQWVALTVVACLAVAAGGWFLLVNPKRSEAAALQDRAAAQVVRNGQLKTQLQVLKAQARDLPKEQAKLAAVAQKVPDNPALPGLVRALLDAAASSGVELVSITPSQPALAQPAAAAPKAGAPATPAAPPTVAPAAPGSKAAPSSGAGQLARIPVTMEVVGSYFEIQAFLAAVEQLPRALRVSNLQMAPGTSPTVKNPAPGSADDGSSLKTTVTGEVFMTVNAPAAVTPQLPAGAAPASTPSATAPVAAAPAK